MLTTRPFSPSTLSLINSTEVQICPGGKMGRKRFYGADTGEGRRGAHKGDMKLVDSDHRSRGTHRVDHMQIRTTDTGTVIKLPSTIFSILLT